jgi:mannose-6-phosphate isomerase-like protein (cupin superfamily)|tara:strand:+ start:1790 stop:2221 length:432 start_codon:yes stop_codon:yes gene_type:complete
MAIKVIMDKENKYGRQELPPVDGVIKNIDKYWGNIKTLFENDEYTVKRIFMRKGTQSSLEYHIKKEESYYIESGKLKIGTRIGRAKNTSLVLNEGEVFHISPGFMHMRIALEDTIIIEFSTLDDDTDSHIVEDGKTYKHLEGE